MEDYTNKYKGEQVEVALFGGDYRLSPAERTERKLDAIRRRADSQAQEE